MAIFIPGVRARNGHAAPTKRNVVAVLQLTAMVDMFTVMVVFLLQNYATTNQVLPLSDKVNLPDAASVKELKPSNVVALDKDGLSLNNTKVATFEDVKSAEDWLVKSLREKVELLIREGEEKKRSLGAQIKDAVTGAKRGEEKPKEEIDEFRRITVQADRQIDFLSIKKVMYTVTEAGIYEINFAVVKRADSEGI